MEAKYVSMEKLLEKIGSVYKLVVLASKRAKAISEDNSKLTGEKHDKPVLTALYEISESKISYKKEVNR